MNSIVGPRKPKNPEVMFGQYLTQRERETMKYLCLGMYDREIAEAMGISTKGVYAHLTNIRYKVGLSRRVLLALWWKEETK